MQSAITLTFIMPKCMLSREISVDFPEIQEKRTKKRNSTLISI